MKAELDKSAAVESPRVLVLLATYNGANWIGEQLQSVLTQEEVDVEVHIADDRSRDGTAEYVRQSFGNDPRVHITVWPQSSGSAGANFRRLFRQIPSTEFSYVALADQDDIWHPRKLRTAIEAIERSGAAGYSCAVQSFWEDGRECVLPQNRCVRAADYLFEGAGQGCTFVMTKALYAEVQSLCTAHEAEVESFHYHDWLIYLIARVRGMPWYFDPRPWMRYRQHSGNEIGSRGGGLHSIFRRLDMVRNGWYRGQVMAALRIGQLVQGHSVQVERFASRFNAADSVVRRITLLMFFLRHGRRRLVDRLVMGIASLWGWI